MNSCALAALAAASTSARVASGFPYLMFSRMLVANREGIWKSVALPEGRHEGRVVLSLELRFGRAFANPTRYYRVSAGVGDGAADTEASFGHVKRTCATAPGRRQLRRGLAKNGCCW